MAQQHPIWDVLKIAIVGAVVVFTLTFNYNGWDSRDYGTLTAILTSLGVLDFGKRIVTRSLERWTGLPHKEENTSV